ncbi:complex I NDUFA9 subunit family protein [Effusibacillus lacus]|uniref:Nucleoside-diphosphate sugar epimerase n=1 Tax=Effusibacillus lacus TaxID=1348429 RepID=A0A292YSC1_9BACL|nr:complex I NDUFA9 subunit family protein [Effusibacillus lacus]TCS76997.1 NADH dehydrogenase [Effusibacillus lacus]GAX91324.1 nucleoside-diphosphate sugar epimerase [Effusibacillus lacus]
MRIFLTGGTGYVGQELLQSLWMSGYQTVCLTRPGSEKKLTLVPETADLISVAYGDVLNPESLVKGMRGCDAVIHLVGIIREFPGKGITFDKLHVEATRNVVEACKQTGIKRYVHMSALGARVGSQSGYSHTKGIAEGIVKESGLDWTIFRPSVIFGAKDEFVNMLAGMIRKAPIVPVIGTGAYRLQPVSLKNVAEGFTRALDKPETIGQIYEVGGPQSYSYDEMIDEIALAMGKKKAKIHMPLALMMPIIRLMEGFAFFPITRAQLTMLLEGNTCDSTGFYRTFDIRPIPFAGGIRQYIG